MKTLLRTINLIRINIMKADVYEVNHQYFKNKYIIII